MNPNFAAVDNWLDLIGNIWIGLVLIAAATIPSYLTAKTHKSLKTETKVIREQLVNGHTTFLRADMDKAIAAIEALAHDVRGIKADLMAEEDRRRRDVAHLENRIGRHRTED